MCVCVVVVGMKASACIIYSCEINPMFHGQPVLKVSRPTWAADDVDELQIQESAIIQEGNKKTLVLS